MAGYTTRTQTVVDRGAWNGPRDMPFWIGPRTILTHHAGGPGIQLKRQVGAAPAIDLYADLEPLIEVNSLPSSHQGPW